MVTARRDLWGQLATTRSQQLAEGVSRVHHVHWGYARERLGGAMPTELLDLLGRLGGAAAAGRRRGRRRRRRRFLFRDFRFRATMELGRSGRPIMMMAPALMVCWIEGGAGFFLFGLLPAGAVGLPGRSRPAPGVVAIRGGGDAIAPIARPPSSHRTGICEQQFRQKEMSTSASSRSAAEPAGAGRSAPAALNRRRLARARGGSEQG
jgi:hypothetical protein